MSSRETLYSCGMVFSCLLMLKGSLVPHICTFGRLKMYEWGSSGQQAKQFIHRSDKDARCKKVVTNLGGQIWVSLVLVVPT